MTDPAPADGRVTLTYEGAQASIVLPVSVRGRRRPSPSPNWLIFRNEVGDAHTLAAVIQIEKAPAGMTDRETLKLWMEEFEQTLAKSPGRKGAVLLSVKRVGGARPQAPTEGAHCVEYAWVSEDRLVPGHRGEAFFMHAHEYACVHPGARVVVTTHYSERYSMKRAYLRPIFDEDVAFLFDSLRLH